MSKFILNLQILIALSLVLNCGSNDADLGDYKIDSFKIEYRENCRSSVITELEEIKVRFYSQEDRWGHGEKTLVSEYDTKNINDVKLDIDLGFYFYEVIIKDTILFSGILSIPSDIDLGNNSITLAKSQKSGFTRERTEEGNWGQKIPFVEITHIHEVTGERYVTIGDSAGNHCFSLNAGRYFIEVAHPDYETIESGGGFSVFFNNNVGVSNFFLNKQE